MRRLLRTGSVVLALVALLAALAPGIARAQTEVALVGTFTDTATSLTGPAGGAFSLASFGTQGKTLVASGDGEVSFCIPNVDPKNCLASFSVPLVLPATSVSGSCQAIVVTLGAIETVVGDRFVLDLQASDPLVLNGGSRQLRCAIARRAALHAPLFTLVPSLNRLL